MLDITKIKDIHLKNKYIKVINLCETRPILNEMFYDFMKDVDNTFTDEDLYDLLESFISIFVPLTPSDKVALCFYSILHEKSISSIKDELEQERKSKKFSININYVNPFVLDKIPFTLTKDYFTFEDDYISTIETDGKISVDSKTEYSFSFAKADCYVDNASVIWFYQNYDSIPVWATVFVDESKNMNDLDVIATCGIFREYAVYNCYSSGEKIKGIFKKNNKTR